MLVQQVRKRSRDQVLEVRNVDSRLQARRSRLAVICVETRRIRAVLKAQINKAGPQRCPRYRADDAGGAALLKHEDDLHLDLRTLSFRFVVSPPKAFALTWPNRSEFFVTRYVCSADASVSADDASVSGSSMITSWSLRAR